MEREIREWKGGTEENGNGAWRRERGGNSGCSSLRRASPAAIHIRYQVLTAIPSGKKRANMNYGRAIMLPEYTLVIDFLGVCFGTRRLPLTSSSPRVLNSAYWFLLVTFSLFSPTDHVSRSGRNFICCNLRVTSPRSNFQAVVKFSACNITSRRRYALIPG